LIYLNLSHAMSRMVLHGNSWKLIAAVTPA
jgi:hypothetical protein